MSPGSPQRLARPRPGRLSLTLLGALLCSCSSELPAPSRDAGEHSDIDNGETRDGGSSLPDVQGGRADVQLGLDSGELADATRADRDSELTDSGPAPPLLYNEAVFLASHNSYEGGTRGSVERQLDEGVRFIELDIHDDAFASIGDYRLGHNSPGDAVDHQAPNPDSDRLGDWLAHIAAWSRDHPGHAPITLGVDVKDDLTDNRSAAEGNLAFLNESLDLHFGEQLIHAAEIGASWPGVESLRDRVLAVLSGHEESRLAYRRDLGANPAVAMNALGQVIEVHDSGTGSLWWWSGQYQEDGSVHWLRHGRYDSGRRPAVVLDDEGWIVEVHQSEHRNTLWYHVALMGEDYEVSWGPSQRYDDGVWPSLRFAAEGTDELHEIHQSQGDDQHWEWRGRLDRQTRRVSWTNNQRTESALFPRNESQQGERRLSVSAGPDASAPDNTLRYATGQLADGRIRYRQTAFVEYQPGNQASLASDNCRFFGAAASAASFATEHRRAGQVVRLWGFNRLEHATNPPVNFPASDEPLAPWYQGYMNRIGAVR